MALQSLARCSRPFARPYYCREAAEALKARNIPAQGKHAESVRRPGLRAFYARVPRPLWPQSAKLTGAKEAMEPTFLVYYVPPVGATCQSPAPQPLHSYIYVVALDQLQKIGRLMQSGIFYPQITQITADYFLRLAAWCSQVVGLRESPSRPKYRPTSPPSVPPVPHQSLASGVIPHGPERPHGPGRES